MKKKGFIISTLVKIIVIGIIITVVASIFLDKNFYYDTLDFIDNLFSPPEVDPMPSHVNMMQEREKGLEYLLEWSYTLEQMKKSEQDYCYMDMASTTKDFREQDLGIVFTSTSEDSFSIKLTQQGADVSRSVTINSPLCMIARPNTLREPNGADINSAVKDILDNFLDAFHENNQQKKQECLTNPSTCALIFSKPNKLSTAYEGYDNFFLQFTLNDIDTASKKQSFHIKYEAKKIDDTKTILSDSSGRLSDSQFLLIKISNNICLMPVASTSRNCRGGIFFNTGRDAGDISLIRRSCFFNSDLEPNSNLNQIPKCGIPVLSEEKIKQELNRILTTTTQGLLIEIMLKEVEGPGLTSVNKPSNKIIFKWSHDGRTGWYLDKPRIIGGGAWERVTEEQLLDRSNPLSTGVLPIRPELENLIIELRNKDKDEGTKFLINFEHQDLVHIKINEDYIEGLKNSLRYSGAEPLEEKFK